MADRADKADNLQARALRTSQDTLFQAEGGDLLSDLRSLPRNSAVRKINELVKRARLAKVHALIIAHLRNNMPTFFGKKKAQDKLAEVREFIGGNAVKLSCIWNSIAIFCQQKIRIPGQ